MMMIKYTLIAVAALALAGCQTTISQAPAKVMYPVEKCGYVNEPIYGILDRPASRGEIIGGAAVGGIVGNVITDGNGVGTALGAIVGGAIANNQRVQSQVVVDSKRVYRCRTVYE
jgi:uncharacterized protein YcfJ